MKLVTDWALTTLPTSEPLDIDSFRSYARIPDNTEEETIQSVIREARGQLETYLARAFLSQTWLYVQSWWTDEIRLPRPPLQSVTSVKYYDIDNTLQTLSTSVYSASTYATPGFIRIVSGQTWPNLYDRWDAIQITYVAGWSKVEEIPPELMSAMRMLAAYRFEHRGDEMSESSGSLNHPAVEALAAPWRVWWYVPTEVY